MKQPALLNILFASLLLCPAIALSWGQTGHRVSGAIASKYLNEEARNAIEKILPNESLAEASTYADEMKSNPSKYWQKTASPFHYITIPKGQKYKKAPKQGDALSALKDFRKTLLDKQSSMDDKQLALRFTVHIIGDLHQPLHVGNGTDRGGNDRKLSFFRKDSNLHRVWDSGMIGQKKLSYTEWTSWLSQKISKEDVQAWYQADPRVWVKESATIRPGVYPDSNSISYDYLYENMPIVKERLQKAGIRIAAYLNEIYAD
ncbi:MAG: hypothetical protein ACI9FB_003333 [Candidatus Azotimanducaceae bacterium]|jgi:hypothetical protein